MSNKAILIWIFVLSPFAALAAGIAVGFVVDMFGG